VSISLKEILHRAVHESLYRLEAGEERPHSIPIQKLGNRCRKIKTEARTGELRGGGFRRWKQSGGLIGVFSSMTKKATFLFLRFVCVKCNNNRPVMRGSDKRKTQTARYQNGCCVCASTCKQQEGEKKLEMIFGKDRQRQRAFSSRQNIRGWETVVKSAAHTIEVTGRRAGMGGFVS
jgi:hypothetical protein